MSVCVHVWLCMRAFRSTTLRPLADKYKTCDEQYEEIQAGLVDKVMSIIATYAPAVEALCELIADAGARVCRRLQFLLLFLVRCILHRASSGSQPCASASVWSPLPSFRFLFSRLLVGG